MNSEWIKQAMSQAQRFGSNFMRGAKAGTLGSLLNGGVLRDEVMVAKKLLGGVQSGRIGPKTAAKGLMGSWKNAAGFWWEGGVSHGTPSGSRIGMNGYDGTWRYSRTAQSLRRGLTYGVGGAAGLGAIGGMVNRKRRRG